MLNNTWIAPPQIRAECNWANKIFLSTYPWRGRVLRWQQLGPCHGASQVRDTLRDMWLSPGYRHHPMSRDTLPGCVTQTTRRWEQNIIWCQSHPLCHICWGQDIKIHNSDMRDSHEYIQKQVWGEQIFTRQSSFRTRLTEAEAHPTHLAHFFKTLVSLKS